MADVVITIGDLTLTARFEEESAPRTTAAFRQRLPLSGDLLHTRWSGEATWVPLGDLSFGVPLENPTSYPRPGEILFYPGSEVSEAEILIPYGRCHFGSKAGRLSATPFLTIVSGAEWLSEIGRHALWKGAQAIRLELADLPRITSR